MATARKTAAKPRGKSAASRSKPTPPPAAPRFRGHVVSVFGPFGSRALVEISAEDAVEMVGMGEIAPAPAFAIDAVRHELDNCETRQPGISASPVAAAALAMAYEISNPATSATAKSMCAARLMEAIDRLRLVPAEEARDRLDELQKRRDARRTKVAKAAGT